MLVTRDRYVAPERGKECAFNATNDESSSSRFQAFVTCLPFCRISTRPLAGRPTTQRHHRCHACESGRGAHSLILRTSGIRKPATLLGEGLRRLLLATSEDDEAFNQTLLLHRNFTSSTAIDIALGSAAAPDLDPNWTRWVSAVYDFIRLYNSASNEAFDTYVALGTDELQRNMFDAVEGYRPVYGSVLRAIAWNRILQDQISPLLAYAKLIEIGRVPAVVAFRESDDLGRWGTTQVALAEQQRLYLRLGPAGAYCIRVAARKGDDLDPVLYLFRLIGENPSAEGDLVDRGERHPGSGLW